MAALEAEREAARAASELEAMQLTQQLDQQVCHASVMLHASVLSPAKAQSHENSAQVVISIPACTPPCLGVMHIT